MSLITKDFLTVKEFAEYHRVTARTVQLWIKAGITPAHETFSGRRWFPKRESHAFQPPKRGRRLKETS